MPRFLVPTALLLLAAALPLLAQERCEPTALDGSWRLETGEVVTGGWFVEQGRGSYLFMDVEGLERGGLFRSGDDGVLRSVWPEGTIEIEVVDGDGCAPRRLLWKERDAPPIPAERVFPHDSRHARFTSADGTVLEGRLLTPRCEGPHPVVVAVHGSGAVDRHGGAYHTFLLQHGVAVLAYDKRGYTDDADAFHRPLLSTLAADAAAAARFAATLPDIDPRRIGFFGTSQGGWTAPPAAVETGAAFLIVRAGAALTGLETLLHEVRQELRAEGMSGLDLDHAMQLRRVLYRMAIEGRPLSATDDVVAPYLDKPWYRIAFGEGPVSRRWSADWWEDARENLAFTSLPWIKRFEGPVLWFLAERDENVPYVATRAGLERVFDGAPGDDHELVVIEDAPHSFLVPTEDGPPRFADGFFDRVVEWMSDRGFTEPACPM